MSRSATRLVSVVVLFLAVTSSPRPASTGGWGAVETRGQQLPPELAQVLERAGRYVLDYQERLQRTAAVERRTEPVPPVTRVRRVEGAVPAVGITQEGADLCVGEPSQVDRRTGDFKQGNLRCHRTTEADAVFLRLEGERTFRVFRDVFEVNDRKVRLGELRLERLFVDHPATAAARAAAALTEQSDDTYDVAQRPRDISSPLLAVLFLDPGNQGRFAWSAKGKRRFGRVETLEVAFEEVVRPTIFQHSEEGDLPARGSVWIDVSLGTLVRSVVEFRFGARARAFVSTEFRPDRDLSLWVPVEMEEKYEDVPGFVPVFRGSRQVDTHYTRFHRLPTPTTAEPSPPNPELVELLRRAGEYVTEYESRFADLVAAETYKQKDGGYNSRTTRADLVFARLAGDIPWASYRDVYEVDGRKPPQRSEALARLISAAPGERRELSRQLLLAGAAYNIGPTRTANLPTLALAFLLPRNQGRLAFRLFARTTIEATEVVEVLFAEIARPTLVNGSRGTDLPTFGRFWINPTGGTVARTELEFDFGMESEARVTVDFRPAPALAMWVPAEMRERYADMPGAATRTFARPFEGVARYSGFRRFTVATEQHETLPRPSSR